MLGSYMEDLRIAPDQFEKACFVATKKSMTQFHQSLFEQVWAADDFEIFRRMMTQKNLELQLQALEELAKKYGLSNCFVGVETECKTPYETPSSNDENKVEHETEIQEQSDASATDLENETEDEQQIIKSALAEKGRLEIEKDKEKELLDQAMKSSLELSSGNRKVETATKPLEVSSENQSSEQYLTHDLNQCTADPTTDILPESVSKVSKGTNETIVVNSDKEMPNEEVTVSQNLKSNGSDNANISLCENINTEEKIQIEHCLTSDTLENKIPDEITVAVQKVDEVNHVILADRVMPLSALNNKSKTAFSEMKPAVLGEAPKIEISKDGQHSARNEDRDADVQTQENISPSEIERRQNYLRQQRDRLLAKKKQERTAHLNAYEETTTQKRPKSAKAARIILHDENHNIDPKTLAFRKSLANRLKDEVVDKIL